MSVAKVTEVISSSSVSIEDAVRKGVKRAAKTLDRVEGVWVKDTKGVVSDGEVVEWRVTMAVTFVLRD